MAKKPTVLMILDGFGLNDNKEANAAKIAKTPVIDKLMAEGKFRGGTFKYGRRAHWLPGTDAHYKGD